MERVLLIRVSALGDVALLNPAIRALRAAHPEVRVDLVTDARYAAFAAAHLGVDDAIGYDRHGEDEGWAGVSQVAARLEGRRYDAVVDLQGKLRTRMLSRRVSARQHLVLRKRTLGQAALSLVGHDPPLVDRRASQLYVDALAPLGVAADAPLELRFVGVPAREARDGLRIGLSVGATHATKRWGADRFAALAEALGEARPGARFSIIGGPSDAEVFEAVQEALPAHMRLPPDARSLDVLGLAGLIAGLDLVVSVDSGPAHLAAGFGVPTVALFGPTAHARWGPVGDAHAVVSLDLDCAPCSNTGGAQCPRADRAHACMSELSADKVLEAALEALARAGR